MMVRFCIVVFSLMAQVAVAKVVDVTLSTQTLRLGETAALIVETTSPLNHQKIRLANRSFKLFLDKASKNRYVYVAYFAVPRSVKRGEYILKLDLKCRNKSRFYEHYRMVVNHPIIPKRGKVKLTKKAKQLSKRSKAYADEGRLLGKRFARRTSKRFFHGEFKRPALGRLSSGFGVVRTYNNGRTSSHAGVDIANNRGTRVVAPQQGKVILSRRLDIHGNTIMIDHGYGIVTVLCHLDKRLVQKGDWVDQGKKIATMGMTGVASGVHVHWGMSVQNVRVNPLFWEDMTVFERLN